MPTTTPASRVNSLDWAQINTHLDEIGHAHLPGFLHSRERSVLQKLYDDPATDFRKTVNMAQHNFGRGEYKYFSYPLPELIHPLRQALYAKLAPVANRWAQMLAAPNQWPATHTAFARLNKRAGQGRATPLMLRYQAGDFNRLHQDIYGDIHFPLQVVFLLDRPDIDFSGGEFLLVEQLPRAQARPTVVPLQAGDAVIFPVRERPVMGKTRMRRALVRHGVSTVHRGQRTTLGLIFHDA